MSKEASPDESLADIAAAALLNARASMDRINSLLTQETSSATTTTEKPPPNLTPEQEVEWWNQKIATLSSDADSKAVVPVQKASTSRSDKELHARADSKDRLGGGMPCGLSAAEETEWMDQRMAMLAVRKDSKNISGSKETK
jgi:hypothetical protein